MSKEVINGVHTLIPKSLTAWTVGAFHGRFLTKCSLQQRRKYYGFIEHETWPLIEAMGMRVYVLENYYDHHVQTPDKDYLRYKQLQVAKDKVEGDFV